MRGCLLAGALLFTASWGCGHVPQGNASPGCAPPEQIAMRDDSGASMATMGTTDRCTTDDRYPAVEIFFQAGADFVRVAAMDGPQIAAFPDPCTAQVSCHVGLNTEGPFHLCLVRAGLESLLAADSPAHMPPNYRWITWAWTPVKWCACTTVSCTAMVPSIGTAEVSASSGSPKCAGPLFHLMGPGAQLVLSHNQESVVLRHGYWVHGDVHLECSQQSRPMKSPMPFPGVLAVIIGSTLPIGLKAQGGTLDPSFGAGGSVITDVAQEGDVARAVAVQADGKVVVAGYAWVGSDHDFALVRFHADGTLDGGFGSNGVVTTDFEGDDDQAHALVIQPDGKLVVAGAASNGTNTLFAVVQYDTDGTMDNSFGNGGMVATDFGIGSALVRAIALQPDGGIVMAGSCGTVLGDVIAVARYTGDGAPDTGFNTDGMVTTDLGAGSDRANAIAVQPDGKIVVVGVDSIGPFSDFAVVRYLTDGTLDSGFGTAGVVVTDMGSGSGTGSDWANAVAILPDGRIVAAGYGEVANNFNFAAARYLPDGTLDASFSGDGRVATSFGIGTDAAYGMALQPDGKIVLAGSSSTGFLFDFALVRYNPNGTLDDTFGTGGKVVTPLAAINDEAYSCTIQPDGAILAAGYAFNGTDDDFAVVRYLPDLNVGLLDRSMASSSALVFPNPISNGATLQYELAREEAVCIHLASMDGRVLMTIIDQQVQGADRHQRAISLPQGLAPGAYFLVVSSPSGSACIRVEHGKW